MLCACHAGKGAPLWQDGAVWWEGQALLHADILAQFPLAAMGECVGSWRDLLLERGFTSESGQHNRLNVLVRYGHPTATTWCLSVVCCLRYISFLRMGSKRSNKLSVRRIPASGWMQATCRPWSSHLLRLCEGAGKGQGQGVLFVLLRVSPCALPISVRWRRADAGPCAWP